ncbi:energy transducer TonB [Flavobacterium sp.]|uniref:energy transducer TonB n=1 Tax=Flavobacterium sp. TaxID=239 RepID=UPI003D6C125A
MSKLNINKNEWLELVFEGKNKEYGAYKLRQEDGKTTMKAFFSALALLAGLASLPMILSSFDKPIVTKPIDTDGPITVVDVVLPPKKSEPAHPKTAVKNTAPKPPVKFVTPVVVKQEDAPQTEVPKNEDLPKTPSTNTDTPGTGTGPQTGGNTGGPATDDPGTELDPIAILPSAVLEKNPNFPGGIAEFLKIVGNKFEAPSIEEERTVKVIVFFVVEKDGSLTNINVPRSPGYGLDKEAIRVLKSIKTKWEPGIYKGKPVRTSYSLPIIVKMQ